MGKAVLWGLVILLIFLVGTHPVTMVGLLHQAVGVFERAGDELSLFISRL